MFANRISQILHDEHRMTIALMERLERTINRRQPAHVADQETLRLLRDLVVEAVAPWAGWWRRGSPARPQATTALAVSAPLRSLDNHPELTATPPGDPSSPLTRHQP